MSAYLTMACLYLWGAYAVSRSRVRLLYLSAGLAAWFALLLSEVAAGPAAVLGCLIICLPLCLAKGLGIRRMGRSLPPWPWEGCGNRFWGTSIRRAP